ncbi:MAG: radical SAM protein [Planctomycetaceae bacterium]|nr:radical SAM protein [Planctomycetaceae bacterium]
MESSAQSTPRPRSPIADHRRQWRNCLYVYPVVSRRSRGLSIGINLNRDKRCNFGCVYCQVDRRVKPKHVSTNLSILYDELCMVLEDALTGRIWDDRRFSSTPQELRRVNDVAFSGNGEPTCVPDFHRAVATAARALSDAVQQFNPEAAGKIKLILLTNATALTSPQVHRALPHLDKAGGEIWAKLDAGTEEQFQRVNRPAEGLTLAKIVENIITISRDRAVVIQSLFSRLDGQAPTLADVAAYCQRVNEIVAAGGRIRAIHVHTIARKPARRRGAEPLTNEELDAIAQQIHEAINVPIEVFYGIANQL